MRLAREDVAVASAISGVDDEDELIFAELWYVAGYEQALRDVAVGSPNHRSPS